MKKILVAAPLLMSLISPVFAAGEITPEMRAGAEEVIQSCEKSYQNTKDQRVRLSNLKKPTFLSSKKKKELYKNKELNLKVFDIQFGEFTIITNEKIAIRTVKTVPELKSTIEAYSSNCTRFSAGIANFVEWAVGGEKLRPGFDTIYKDWQAEARKK
ncbi:MAG: hypothetical protein GW748_04290 [Alphaproteobacteria bacterium]|nr:hypothetical protein [Alphaproteobacteria bacterium]NCQ66942.1 hypothetical protein [Alphaproteobacteria bacterium]NCT07509.1 hypothetical protein [Alphaproteobacteria bacterium]